MRPRLATVLSVLAALLAGLVWAGSFPGWGNPAMAWLAPAALLLISRPQQTGAALRLAYVAGVTHHLVSLRWLLHIPFPIGAVSAWLALSAYMALFPTLWCWLCWRLAPTSTRADTGQPGLPALASASWAARSAWTLTCAAAWAGLELVSSRFLSGFPWNLLGTSQYESVALIQVASFTGVYGVSFLVAWFSASLLCASARLCLRPSRPTLSRQLSLGSSEVWGGLRDLVLPIAVIGSCLLFGLRHLGDTPAPERSVRFALVQPSIPQNLIFDPKENTNRFNKLLELSTLAMALKPDVLVWPEAAVPNLLRYDPHNYGAVTNLLAGSKTWMILGADDAEPVLDSPRPNEARYFNSAFLVSPDGTLAANYRKQRLVIFGEYVPLTRWLPFLRYLTPIDGGFEAGRAPGVFEIPSVQLRAGMLICFEDVFPQCARECVDERTDLLVNLTNLGWFGESDAHWQHAAAAVFRAVENRRPMVRCTNNGLTCWIDAAGRLHGVYFGDSKDIYGPGIKSAILPIPSQTSARELTYYTRHGDVFAASCLSLTVALQALRRRQRSGSSMNTTRGGVD